MKNRFTIVEFPVFSNYVVHVEFTSDIKKTMLKYLGTKAVEVEDGTDGLAVHMPGNMSFIFLKHDCDAGDIAHESWHVIKRMMEYFGVQIGNETVAYHIGYLVNKITKFKRSGK